ncbi:hybrid sensor histidine kinase/response regulator [Altibacter lentus]|uniref:hybrid sensor histidine kinase/response regulator n=1 Tax=Altibacter lentus TaxID=1223410 RepID=UPI00068E4204|nr:hybrid sensor histidine kinase/response regulator [Altibacter lentus]
MVIIPKRYYWFSFGIMLAISITCLFIYGKAKQQLDNEYKAQIQTVGRLSVQDFERTVRNNIGSLENIKDRIEESEGAFMQYFESDANRIISQHPSFRFIEFIDSDGIIRQIVPLIANEEALLLDIKPLEYRYSEWINNSRKDITNMTPWIPLTQEGEAFLVDVPVYIKGKFYGTVTAGMDFSSQFDEICETFKDHSVLLTDQNGTVFYSYNEPNPGDFPTDRQFEAGMKPIGASGKTWSFQLLYRDNEIYKERELIQLIGLFFGFLLSFVISLLVFLFLKSRHNKAHQETINTTLSLLNTELEEQKQEAQKASTAKSDFLSNMSHEIRTPLNAILGFADILQTKDLLKKERVYLKLMRNSAQTLLVLVNDILDMEKIESGKMEVSEDRFKPADQLQKIINTYKPQLQERTLEVNKEFSSHCNSTVLGDVSKFNQIFTNLLTNAIKFTKTGGITIRYTESFEKDRLKVSYSVSDTGVGIPKDKLPSIFDRFVQVENGFRKRHEGGGLGLAITKELVHLLEGEIGVTSKVGKGSCFAVEMSFPLVEDRPGTINERNKDLSHIKSLIVDDNRINRMILYNILLQVGIRSESVGSGLEAIEKTRKHNYDLIFMDIHMPDMDGFEATEKLLQIQEDLVVLGLSADVTKEAIRNGRASGMCDYLTKPIDKEALFRILNKHFSSKPLISKSS